MINLNNVDLYKKARLAIKYPTTSIHIATDLVRSKFLNDNISSFPRIITLYATNKCNLNCAMCLNSAYRNKNLLSKEISLNTIKKILPELIKNKPMVCLSGGEPLLNKDLFKIISVLSRGKIFTSLTTNGYILEKYVNDIINSGLEFISISLDHFEENIHDSGRGVKNTYKNLFRGLNKLLKYRQQTPSNIKINTVINKNNYRDLSKMYDFIEKLGIDEWSVQHYSFVTPIANKSIKKYHKANNLGDYISGDAISNNYFFNKKQIQLLRRQLNEINNKAKYYKTKLSIKPDMNSLLQYYQGTFPSKRSNCIWPFISVNIMEGTKIMLCLGNEIGDLKKSSSILKMWQSEKTQDFQKLILKEKIIPPCFRCCGLNYFFN